MRAQVFAHRFEANVTRNDLRAAVLRALFDRPLARVELDIDGPVVADCGAAAVAQVGEYKAELVEQFLPVYPSQLGSGPLLRSGALLDGFDRVPLHEY